ncbi:hypothetical protein BGX38DRAFT_1147698 [Terfezia claveryi]|nr:hypothetical protein BGX38DRAFT_1147698 [Terfezia claveryi]
MSFDYGSNDRDRDRDHSDRRGQGGYNNERDGAYSGGRTAVHDSRSKRGHGNDERFEENRNHSRAAGGYGNDGRRNDDYISASHNRRNGREDGGDYERGGYGSGSNNDSYQSGEYQEIGYGRETRRENYSDNERQGYGSSGRRCKEQHEDRDTYSSGTRRNDDAPNNSASAAYHNNNSRASHTGSLGVPGGANSGSGAIDWQTVGTQVAVAGIQHFAKSYDKSSNINNEEQRKYDDADGVGGSQAKESAFAKKLGERKGETEKLGHETGDLKDKLVEGGLGFLKGAFGGRK